MDIRTSPCDWPMDYCQPNNETCFGDDLQAQAKFEQMAAEYLWRWTGRVFGLCDLSIRPCRAECLRGSTFWGREGARWVNGMLIGIGGSGVTPYMWNGQWFNMACGQCGADQCGCGFTPSIQLPGPVSSITEILIDGLALDSDAYRVDNYRTLVRTDGERWPTCQNMTDPVTEEGTWEVSYKWGIPVPVGGQIAGATLACELYKAACNDSSCALPQRIQTVTRQGITVAMLDSFDDIDTGKTGIWTIDSWVSSIVNSPRGSSVRSPDYNGPRSRRTTWP